MIKSFKCLETEKIYNEERSKKFPVEIQTVALRKLRMIHTALCLDDLRSPPNNRLEKLLGNRLGYYSIRINNQYRLCFVWAPDNHAQHVEIVDYHH